MENEKGKIINPKPLLFGTALKLGSAAAFLVLFFCLYSVGTILCYSTVLLLIVAAAIIIPTAIAYYQYYKWFNDYAPRKSNGQIVRVKIEDLKENAKKAMVISIPLNIIFAAAVCLVSNLRFPDSDPKTISIFSAGAAFVLSVVDFAIFSIPNFAPNAKK